MISGSLTVLRSMAHRTARKIRPAPSRRSFLNLEIMSRKRALEIFSRHPAPAAERPPGKLSERLQAQVFSRQRSEEVQGRKNVPRAEGSRFSNLSDRTSPRDRMSSFLVGLPGIIPQVRRKPAHPLRQGVRIHEIDIEAQAFEFLDDGRVFERLLIGVVDDFHW